MIACFKEGTRFAFLGNQNSHMGQRILSAFHTLGVSIQIPDQKTYKESFEIIKDCADIFIVCDKRAIDGLRITEYIEKTKKSLDIEKYFYSLEPTMTILKNVITPQYLKQCQITKLTNAGANVFNWLKGLLHI
ncbi:hypothetical protein [Harryflintia acetispora]|uniref:hypothetical protein n=1 Tax=Harryflintia acetispora TaxID=1849041 RepID=UPI00104AFF83|nr:hypothetical protein [Harryflintia acetispora]